MKKKSEVDKAYKECVDYMQTLDVLTSETNLKARDEVTRCAAWQECLLWVLGQRDKNSYRPFDFTEYLKKSVKKEGEDEFFGI